MHDSRLLALLVEQGHISPEHTELVLSIQAGQRRTLEKDLREKCGEIVVRMQMASQRTVKLALEAQGKMKRGLSSFLASSLPRSVEVSHIQAGTVFLAVLCTAVSWWKFGAQTGGVAASLSSLGVIAVNAFLQYRFRSGFWSGLGYALVLLAIIAFPLAVIGVVDVLEKTATVSVEHDSVRDEVSAWHTQVRTTVVLLAVVFMLAVAWALMLRRSAGFVKARAGLLKDMMIRVGDAQRGPGGSKAARRTKAIKIVLDSLRGAMCLRYGSLRWLLGGVGRNAQGKVTAGYLEPNRAGGNGSPANAAPVADAEGQTTAAGKQAGRQQQPGPNGDFTEFKFVDYSWYPKVSGPVSDMFEWIRDKWRPAAWDEDLHDRLWAFAEEKAKYEPKLSTEEIYRCLEDHDRVGSLTGFVYARGKVAKSNDASKHLNMARPDKYLEADGFTPDTIQWIKVRSFIACPVPAPDGGTQGVLLVLRTDRKGFEAEDSEIVVAASQLLASIAP